MTQPTDTNKRMIKLLVADDEPTICRMLESFFGERGYEVLLTHDGERTLALIRDFRPHLVLLDLRMPGVSGLEILRQARALDETIKVIIITAVEDEETIRQARALGACDYVLKPFSLNYLKEEVLTKVYASLYEDLRRSNEEMRRSYQKLQQVSLGIVGAFSKVLSKTDPHYTHEHTARSVDYASQVLAKLREMGVELGSMPEEMLLAGVLLHDIGKIFTPREILFKPGPLTEEEWTIMRRHPVDGAEILEQIDGLKEMADIVRYHQEAYNGTGYPEGLKGENIPIGSRIAAVVDAFDAMITDRPYRKGMTLEKAIEELKRCRGGQFDPQVVDAIIAIYEEGKLRTDHHHGQGQAATHG